MTASSKPLRQRTHARARAIGATAERAVALAPAVSSPTQVAARADLVAAPPLWTHAWDYQTDVLQRSVLFLDTLRQRGENFLSHEQAGLPPLLDFMYETVLDARQFDQPANYALLKITPHDGTGPQLADGPDARPVMVFDPRAGHGPGIGGFKNDSEVGMALQLGHPVYFVIFFPDPCPGQTLADVHHAWRRFVAEVAARHAGRPPVLYGNCQAGWAVVLLSADCVGTAGPAVLNGSPLSYWAGAPEVNPMRLAGGLAGGAWAAHFIADLADGTFDGAWLAQNFEQLNPANTLWEKNYDLFASVDTQRERFLQFERWWSGYYRLSREEIVSIVENLFVGNKLEQGLMRICEHCVADLRRIRNPILVFASSGDNITPPHQALNWIPAIYPTTDELKAAGQRIAYLLNPHVGHLGIFVSASVARREHRAILDHLDDLDALEPGLYEMKITDRPADQGSAAPSHCVRFEPRRVEDIRYEYPREAFERVQRVSELNEFIYSTFASPFVQRFASPWGAELLKWLHPMRASRYLFAERFSPWMVAIKAMAAAVNANRNPVAQDNPFLTLERAASESVSQALQAFRRVRDQAYESSFSALYGYQPATVAQAPAGTGDLPSLPARATPHLQRETHDEDTSSVGRGQTRRPRRAGRGDRQASQAWRIRRSASQP